MRHDIIDTRRFVLQHLLLFSIPVHIQSMGYISQILIRENIMKTVASRAIIGCLFATATTISSAVASVSPDWTTLILNKGAVAGDGYGMSIGLTNDTLVVGTLDDRIRIFSKEDDGRWAQGKDLSGDSSSNFGHTVAISGKTMVVSNASWDNPAKLTVLNQAGNGEWQQDTVFTETDELQFDPSTVSIDGDTIMVATSSNDTKPATHVFRRNPEGSWNQEAKITLDELADNEHFGGSISISGDTAIVSATRTNGSIYYTGSAYVFSRDSSGLWHKQARLSASDGSFDPQMGGDVFGHTVAISGDTVLVGSYDSTGTGPQCNSPTTVCAQGPGPSSAYVFELNEYGEWIQKDKLFSDTSAERSFSSYVSIDDDFAVVGSGTAAYVYRKAGSNEWVSETKIAISDKTGVDYTLAMTNAGDMLAIGTVDPQRIERGDFGRNMVIVAEKCDPQRCIPSHEDQNPDAVSNAVTADDQQVVQTTGAQEEQSVASDNSQDGSQGSVPGGSEVESGGGSYDFFMLLWLALLLVVRFGNVVEFKKSAIALSAKRSA